MDAKQLLGQLRSTVDRARSLPMSSSAVIDRREVLGQIDALEAALGGASEVSERMFPGRDGVVADSRGHAERIIEEATRERDRLVSDSEVVRVGLQEVEQLRLAAQRDCEALRKKADEYVDGRLANLEVSLRKTLEAVTRGRDRLGGRSELDRLAGADDNADGHSDDNERSSLPD